MFRNDRHLVDLFCKLICLLALIHCMASQRRVTCRFQTYKRSRHYHYRTQVRKPHTATAGQVLSRALRQTGDIDTQIDFPIHITPRRRIRVPWPLADHGPPRQLGWKRNRSFQAQPPVISRCQVDPHLPLVLEALADGHRSIQTIRQGQC